jgi:hypothetical protein
MRHNNNEIAVAEHPKRNDDQTGIKLFEPDNSVLNELSLNMTKQVDKDIRNHQNTMDQENTPKPKESVKDKEKLPALRGKSFFHSFLFTVL